ncbi:MAG TPA: tRNA (adenosine(37)-N6)-dimethylallyltransferase MiaA [Actinomycetes bacterium]|nr:tRNA (adenosine(37)-N6)-dimethylallyltransferase MiaA [Actinomycetes bacterium]
MSVVAVVGATAVGKSEYAVNLALEVDGEVVNADSMQLYRGMDIGTAKLTEAERRGVPHHLLDIWPVTRTATLAEYQQRALAAVDDVLGRGKVPIVVGGSGMYVHSVIDRWDIPGTDPDLRAELEHELATLGPEAMHQRLAKADPAAAIAILPTNGRRIVRALEVVAMRGSFSAQLPSFDPNPDLRIIGLRASRDELDARIEQRVDRMWERGFVDEVRRLEAEGLRQGLTASRALGYAQVLAYLAGECTEEQAREDTIRATRRFARRQESWFNRDPRIEWTGTPLG